MRQLFSIALLQFRLSLKQKGTVVMMFALPLAFTALFGLLIGGGGGGPVRTPVAVVDRDGSYAASQVIAALEQDDGLEVVTAAEGELDRLFADHRIDAGVIIPAGFEAAAAEGGAPEVMLVKAPGGNMEMAAQPAIVRAATVVAEDYALARQLNPAKPAEAYGRVASARQTVRVGVTESREAARPDSAGSQLQGSAIGMTVMFVMMMLVTMSGVILQERAAGTWGRLLMAPVSRLSLLGGYLLAFFLTGSFQMAVLVGASSLLFGINWGPLPQLAAVSAAVVLCSAGFGLFLAALVRTAEQQRAIGVALVIITCFLGGVFWPMDLMGRAMQMLGRLTLQYWAIDALQEVMLRGGAWSHLAEPLAALGGLTLLFLGVGLARMRVE